MTTFVCNNYKWQLLYALLQLTTFVCTFASDKFCNHHHCFIQLHIFCTVGLLKSWIFAKHSLHTSIYFFPDFLCELVDHYVVGRFPWVKFFPKSSICVNLENFAMTQLPGLQTGTKWSKYSINLKELWYTWLEHRQPLKRWP